MHRDPPKAERCTCGERSARVICQAVGVNSVVEWVFLFGAGLVAGIVGTAGGITSLIAYPALLLAGIPPLAANVTNSVALLGSGFSSALRAGPDITGHEYTLRRWMPPTVLFSLAGAVLLVVTPSAIFDRVVPFLVATGAVILLLQPANLIFLLTYLCLLALHLVQQHRIQHLIFHGPDLAIG